MEGAAFDTSLGFAAAGVFEETFRPTNKPQQQRAL